MQKMRTGLDGLLLDVADVGGPGPDGKTQRRLRSAALAIAALGLACAAQASGGPKTGGGPHAVTKPVSQPLIGGGVKGGGGPH